MEQSISTVHSWYLTVFIQRTHKRHRCGVSLWIQNLNNILSLSVLYYVQYHVIMAHDRVKFLSNWNAQKYMYTHWHQRSWLQTSSGIMVLDILQWSPVISRSGETRYRLWHRRDKGKPIHMGQHGTHLGPVGPRLAPYWPHEPCYLGMIRQLSNKV